MTPSEVAALTEEEARALFKVYRFPKSGGEPYCDRCGVTAVNEYKCRAIYKCKGCSHKFSLTSGTAFAYKKIGFKCVMLIIAYLSSNKQGVSASYLTDDLRRLLANYKTAWIWLHKVRDALKAAQSSIILGNEVEVDGTEVGGYIRPTNTRKRATDHRKFPYQHPDRKMHVTFARERHGQIRAWVGKKEYHCVPRLVESLRDGTHVFTDRGNWGDIADAGFMLHQVNHSEQYQSAEASTNWCESLNHTLTDIEHTHRHICGNYLDLYAAQAAWRGDNTLDSPEKRYASTMRAMLSQKRSSLAGYYLPKAKGGKKRKCEIVDANGDSATWSPPKKPARFAKEPNHVPTLREARSARYWNAGFQFVDANTFIEDATRIPFDAGVYAIFVKGGERLLRESGFVGDQRRESWTVMADYRHLYTGEAYSLRQRLKHHISGTAFESNLRETLLALCQATGVLSPGVDPQMEQQDVEEALTSWMKENVLIGYKPCHYVKDQEAAILNRAESALNIAGRSSTPYSALLLNLRRRFGETTLANWTRPNNNFTGKRRPRG